MNRFLSPISVGLLMVTFPMTAQAEGRVSVNVSETNAVTDDPLMIIPAAEPVPALRYQFWPPLRVQKPTNAMPFFSRAVLMATTTRLQNSDLRITADRQDRWLDSNWKAEYADEIREFLSHYSDSLAELERATDCMHIDYPIVDSSLSLGEMYGLMLPEVQDSRDLAKLLRLRAKLEMHSGRWNEFTRTMQTMFRLSEMVGHVGDLLVSRLVAIAIVSVAVKTVQEASTQPGCPNFYWALASLPTGLLDVHSAIDQELQMLPNLTPGLATNPDTPVGAVAARAKLAEIIHVTNELQLLSESPSADQAESRAKLTGGLVVIAVAEQSREYLRAQTGWGDHADELSDSECVLRAFAIEVDRTTSNILKWNWLPDSIRLQNAGRSEDEMHRLMTLARSKINPAAMILNLVLPATAAACRAEYRGKQSIALQATVESIRDFAAEHKRLPESLDELALPAWPDPMTQKPFGYARTTPQTATLTRGEHHHGDEHTTSLLQLTE